MKTPILFSLLIATATIAAEPAATHADSANKPGAAVRDTTRPSSGPSAMQAALLDLKSELKDAFQQRAGDNMNGIDLCMYALARIEVTYQFLIENFPRQQGKPTLVEQFGSGAKEKKAREMFEACSLLSGAAMIQLQQRLLDNELSDITVRRDSIHSELTKVYEKIADFERSKASDLRAKLDAENAKNRSLQEDADKRFKSLESELIKVRKDARGTIISVSDLLFGFDKADVTPDLKTSLAKIAGILSVYKKCKVAVEGHTDNIGTEAYNKDLSTRRAGNVRDFLVSQGVEVNRLSAYGYGFKRPIATNSTPEGRAQNRRVDLVVSDIR